MAVTVKGLKKLINKLDKLGVTTEKVMQEALVISGKKVQREAKLLISTSSPSGIFYGRHRASAAGEAPASDTGNLVRNIKVKEEKRSVKVGILDQKAIYGAYLEFGTSTIAPRPWLKPATDMSKDFIKKSFTIALKKNIKRIL
tara:strand:- start:524 stop:952 length:429 start_codon:yes stop_codon:yes gene_type:complete